MLFALLTPFKKFAWLIIGALATGLTYASIAAIHALVMTWSGHPYYNPDFFAAVGILAFSAVIAVPLLNWSKRIKEIGKGKEESGEYAGGRTIIVYWSILIFIALFGTFITIWKTLLQSDFHGDGLLFPEFVAFTFTEKITPIGGYFDSSTCSPPGGVVDKIIGQDTDFELNLIALTKEFLDHNKCHDPCSELDPGTIEWTATRSVKELTAMSESSVRQFVYQKQNKLSRPSKRSVITDATFVTGGTAVMALIVLQGLLAILSGRRWPVELRNWTYMRLRPGPARV